MADQDDANVPLATRVGGDIPNGVNPVARPIPHRNRRVDSPRLVRKELGRVYNLALRQEITPATATKFAYVLTCIARSLETEENAARIQALEDRMRK